MVINTEMNKTKIIENKVKDILKLIGENEEREGLLDTPKRVAKMYQEIFKGYQVDPSLFLKTTFKEQHDDLVLVKDINFYSHCEHHMVPFYGKAHIAYIPNGNVVGLSKLARMVEAFSQRLQVQERLTQEIVDCIQNGLSPAGVMVVLEAEHLCMTMRGIKKPGAKTVTLATEGLFRTSIDYKNSVMSMINN